MGYADAIETTKLVAAQIRSHGHKCRVSYPDAINALALKFSDRDQRITFIYNSTQDKIDYVPWSSIDPDLIVLFEDAATECQVFHRYNKITS